MVKNILTLMALTLSMTANAAIVDLGNITRDTSTGLDWLDLTETNGRSYTDISSKLGAGQEFDGWHYATIDEVETLWENMGISHHNLYSEILKTYYIQYPAFIQATTLLGNTYKEYRPIYDYGVAGITGESSISRYPDYHNITGMNSEPGWNYVRGYRRDTVVSSSYQSVSAGSYLIKSSEVPVPPAGWLFLSGLIGFVVAGRRK